MGKKDKFFVMGRYCGLILNLLEEGVRVKN